MGGAVSAGSTNDELIDNLVDADYIKSPHLQQVFRAVDRADYYLEHFKENAYKDLAWKHGKIHMSAPCIYAEVLENLHLQPGHSFLNIGSGTGYFSTLVGLLIGPYGVNHGIEIHAEVVEYARERLNYFVKHAELFDAHEFAVPEFTVGNCLCLQPGCRLYDRVYCGAACPPEHENYMKNLISVGGILVMPLNDQLLKVTRKSETEWEATNVLPVSFATLVEPQKEHYADLVVLSEVVVTSLQDLCRVVIRAHLREAVRADCPEVDRRRVRAPAPRGEGRRKRRRINIQPLPLHMMVDLDDPDGTAAGCEPGGASNKADDEEEDEDEDEDDEAEDDDSDESTPSMNEILRRMAVVQQRFVQMNRESENAARQRLLQTRLQEGEESSPEEEGEEEEGDDTDEGVTVDEALDEEVTEPAEEDNVGDHVTSQSSADHMDTKVRESDSESADEMDTAEAHAQRVRTKGLPLPASAPKQTSQSSASTSVTSGVGTCSSVEEQSDLDLSKETDCDISPHRACSRAATAAQANNHVTKDQDTHNDDTNGVTSQEADDESSVDNNNRGASPAVLMDLREFLRDTEEEEDPLPQEEDHADPAAVQDDEGAAADVTEGPAQPPGPTWRAAMRDRVHGLPVPPAVKQYLLFYRA